MTLKEEFLKTKTLEEYEKIKEKFRGLDWKDKEIMNHLSELFGRVDDSGYHDGVIHEVYKL